MHDWISGWGWLWMTFMMVFWVGLLAAAVYAAVRLAQRRPPESRSWRRGGMRGMPR